MLWTPAWLVRHAVALALVVAFLWLGWWQVGRAASGNLLSYAYAVEWPVFAGFVVFVWVKEVRRARAATDGGAAHSAGPAGAASGRSGAEPAVKRPWLATGTARADAEAPPLRSTRPARVGPGWEADDDEQLTAYNRYLAWLAANPSAKPADYREG